MAFDFTAIKAQRQTIISMGTPKIIGILGPRGYGKSSVLGTLPRTKPVLMVLTQPEIHSYAAAAAIANKTHGSADHLHPFFIDKVGETLIQGDVVVAKLIELLNDENTPKFFPFVCLDSLAALDVHVQATTLVAKADKFSVGKESVACYDRIFNAVRLYVQRGGCFIYTVPTEVFEGVATAKLRGTAALNTVLGGSSVIVRMEKVTHRDGDAVTTDYCLAFAGGELQKKQNKIKSMSGSGKDLVIDSIPVTLSFACRIAGIPMEKIPSVMEADLSELLDIMDKGGVDFTTTKEG